jgi:hypothetical protein
MKLLEFSAIQKIVAKPELADQLPYISVLNSKYVIAVLFEVLIILCGISFVTQPT